MSFNFSNKSLGKNTDSQTTKQSPFKFEFKKPESTASTSDSQTAKPSGFSFSFKKPDSNNTNTESQTTKQSPVKFSFNKPESNAPASDSQEAKPTGFSFNFKKPDSNNANTDSQTTKQSPFKFEIKKPESTASASGSQTVKPNAFTFGKTDSNNSASNTTSTASSNSFSFKPSTNPVAKLTFNFGTDKDFQAEKKEFSASTFNFTGNFSPKPPSSSQTAQSKDEEDTQDNIENGFCEAEKTGEEDEEILLNVPSKLYAYVKPEITEEDEKTADPKAKKEEPKPQYAERGIGDLHFNYNKEQKFYRLILRRKKIGTVVLNQRIFPEMKPQKLGKNSLKFLGQISGSSKPGEEAKPNKIDVLLLKLKDEETTDKLLGLIQKAISESK